MLRYCAFVRTWGLAIRSAIIHSNFKITGMVRETRQLIASQHPGRRSGDVQLHELLGTRYAVQHEKMMPNLTQRRLKNQRKLRLCVRPKRKLNTLHYWLIVQLRYGSLERFNEVQRSISEVAQLMRLTYRTVQYILQRF